MPRITILGVAAAAIAIAAISACESTRLPTVAGLAGQPAVTSTTTLTISPDQVTISVGSTVQLTANAGAGSGQLQWSSSIPQVATVSPTGLVTAFTPGATIISVRFPSDTIHVGTATVLVSSP